MGTRADFYVGVGETAEWIGSVANDGDPTWGPAKGVLAAASEADYRRAVEALFAEREREGLWDDATRPADGWPRPWDDSRGSDFAYAFVEGAVRVFQEGEADEGVRVYPNMGERRRIAHGSQGGFMLLGLGPGPKVP